MCVRERQSIAQACAALPFAGEKNHAPPTSRLITGVPRLGCGLVEEGVLSEQGANKISHLH